MMSMPGSRVLPLRNRGVRTSAPSAFAVDDWSIVGASEAIDVTINALPSDGGSAITDIEYRLDDSGAWISSGGIDDFTISGLAGVTEYDVRVRAVNGIGSGAQSDLKTATTTAVTTQLLWGSGNTIRWGTGNDMTWGT